MTRKIEIQFGEETPVDIPAVTASARAQGKALGLRRRFWLGWQLFGAE